MLNSITQNSFVRMFVGVCLPLFAAAPLIAGCEEEGPAEQMGETIDESAEEAGDQMEDAADQMEDTADQMEETTDNQ